MLEIRPSCENCNKQLPPHSEEAMICAFECTFCANCVESVLQNVCPNCSGGFEKRPIRPKKYLSKYPASKTVVFKPVDTSKFQSTLEEFRNVKPSER